MQTMDIANRHTIDIDRGGDDGRRVSMPRYRCLLVMELVPDVIEDRPAYRFRLLDLDGDAPHIPVVARTTDEVIEFLQSHWNRQFNPPAPTQPDSS